MPSKIYLVIDEYSSEKHGRIKATPAVLECVKLFKKE
jgi:hypothetical protein